MTDARRYRAAKRAARVRDGLCVQCGRAANRRACDYVRRKTHGRSNPLLAFAPAGRPLAAPWLDAPWIQL